MPATPTPVPTARTGRADSATRDAVGSAASTTASSTDAAKAEPLDALARIEVTAASDADNQGNDADASPTAWLAAQPTSNSTDRAAATDSRVPVLSLAPPVDSDAWAPALGQQMLRMSASGMHTAQLNLNPEHLGPLQITLKLGEDQAQAVFSSAHEGVRKAVEAALPQLRTSLAEHGISLGQTSVGADTRQPSGQNAFAGDQPSGRSNGNAGSNYPGAGRDTTVGAVEARPTAPVRSTRAEGAVDTFA
jgi:flagellar hook-length control protein FliK